MFHLICWHKRPNTDAAAAGAPLMQRGGGRSSRARRSSGARGRARTRGCRCSATATCLGRLGATRYFSTSKARKLSANSRLCSAAATCLGQLGATRHFCTGKASIFALVKLANCARTRGCRCSAAATCLGRLGATGVLDLLALLGASVRAAHQLLAFTPPPRSLLLYCSK